MTDPNFTTPFERVNAEQIQQDNRLDAPRAVVIFAAAVIIVVTGLLILAGAVIEEMLDPTRNALACHFGGCV